MRCQTVKDIIASRLNDIRARQAVLVEQNKKEYQQGYLASRMASVVERECLDNEDKLFLMQFMEQRERIYFDSAFPSANIKWMVSKQRVLVDRYYDPELASLYAFRGQLYFYSIDSQINQDESLLFKYQATQVGVLKLSKQQLSIGRYQGIGILFNQKHTDKAIVFGQNLIVLVVYHSADQLKMIERNCMLTVKEKEEVLNKFSLFKNIDNFKKNYLSCFIAKKYSKGDTVYDMGDLATHFYLIVRGQVEFFQMSSKKYLYEKSEKQDSRPINHLRRKQNKKSTLFITQRMGEGCCFGQEELINQTMRGHTARFLSAECLLLVVSLQNFRKLMKNQEFASQMKSLSEGNIREKQSKLQIFSKMEQSASPQPSKEIQQNYSIFKTRVLNRLSQSQKIQQPRKLSLRRSKRKIMHGHTVKIPRNTNCVTEQSQTTFSMLRVNQSMYMKTLKRFRHSLKDIQEQKKPKKKVELSEGRSLQKVWNALGLKDIFSDADEQGETQFQQPYNGRTLYQSHLKIKRNIRENGAFRPKGLTTNCRLKKQYIQYLQRCV